MNRYSYKELREKAVATDATQEDLKALVEWLSTYDLGAWNGEYYDISAGDEPTGSTLLYPIYGEQEDEGIIGWEVTPDA